MRSARRPSRGTRTGTRAALQGKDSARVASEYVAPVRGGAFRMAPGRSVSFDDGREGLGDGGDLALAGSRIASVAGDLSVFRRGLPSFGKRDERVSAEPDVGGPTLDPEPRRVRRTIGGTAKMMVAITPVWWPMPKNTTTGIR